jgi:Xaa-Pro aminopeptidase
MNWQSRLKALRAALTCDGLLIENPIDIFYLTGVSVSRGRLLLTRAGATLFVDGRYLSAAKEHSPCSVAPEQEWKAAIAASGSTIGFDSTFMTCDSFQKLIMILPNMQWQPLIAPVQSLRSCKDAEEIAALKEAAELTRAGIAHIRSLLKEGVTEQQLAWEFEVFCRTRGASGLSFESIIAFGKNGAYPHYRAGSARLQKGDAVLMDVGAIVKDYHGDLTQIAFFGEVPPALQRMDRLVRQAQEDAIAHVRPGVRAGELDKMVHNFFAKEGVDHLFTHGLGHGVGIETHEFPRLRWDGADKDAVLTPGMVITIEPGLYQPGVGGIRHEAMIHVTKTGHERI